MREVTKDEFFADIGKRNVHPTPTGDWPYTSIFKTPEGHERGRIVDYLPEGQALTASRYYLPGRPHES